MGWLKYIEQDFYKEEPEIYEEEIQEVCKNLKCKPEDVLFINSDEDYELIKEITNNFWEGLEKFAPINGLFEFKGVKICSNYIEGGLVCVFSKIKI